MTLKVLIDDGYVRLCKPATQSMKAMWRHCMEPALTRMLGCRQDYYEHEVKPLLLAHGVEIEEVERDWA